jgi:hypothetical protein
MVYRVTLLAVFKDHVQAGSAMALLVFYLHVVAVHYS